MSRLEKSAVALAIALLSAPAFAVPPPVQVPEPGTFGLMAVGVIGLVATALRRRK